MQELSSNRVHGLLAKHLPGPYVTRFMKDRSHGFLHGQKVADTQQKLQKFGTLDLTGGEMNALQWATALHDIADIGNPTEYRKLFAGYEISQNSLSPLLSGLKGWSSAKIVKVAGQFKSALQNPELKLCSFHHLAAALFVYDILQGELGSDAVIAAQAILFHHERDIRLIPANPVVRFLRDSVRIESLNEWGLTMNITGTFDNQRRRFFTPDIPLELRMEVLESRIGPDDQELRDPKLKLDAFQFALKSIFIDTKPDMFAMPEIVGPYLRDSKVFLRFLNRTIQSAEQQNEGAELQIENLGLIKTLLNYAAEIGDYAGSVEMIARGVRIVDDHLTDTLYRLEDALQLTPSSIEIFYLKAKTLQVLGDLKESNDAYAEAFLQQGFALMNQKNPEEAFYQFELSEKYKPRNFEALSNMGGALFQLKKYDEAVKFYDKAIAAGTEQDLPKLRIVRVIMVKAYTLLEPLHYPNRALEAIKEALKLLPKEDLAPEDTTMLPYEEETDILREEALEIARSAENYLAPRN